MIIRTIKFVFFATYFLLLLSFADKKDYINIKLRIISNVSVGWGDIYIGVINKASNRNIKDFSDTIRFTIIAKPPYMFFKNGDEKVITFKNTRKKNKLSYLPILSGTISKRNKIWLITRIE
ncbi:MAG: hypothetical protein JNJ41_02350 [Bacteroidia bacterium]|nr:hypothetical protein [Bacteroidia bacterium]